MNLYNETNIKNLPEVEQITNGDYLIVENFAGTNKLNFENFIIGPDNTSFFDAVATSLYDLSATGKTLSTAVSVVSSSLDAGLSAINNKFINTLTTTVTGVTGVSSGNAAGRYVMTFTSGLLTNFRYT
jgi:hypothetical protein